MHLSVAADTTHLYCLLHMPIFSSFKHILQGIYKYVSLKPAYRILSSTYETTLTKVLHLDTDCHFSNHSMFVPGKSLPNEAVFLLPLEVEYIHNKINQTYRPSHSNTIMLLPILPYHNHLSLHSETWKIHLLMRYALSHLE